MPESSRPTESASRVEIDDQHLALLIGRLSLERKIELLTGRDFWSTVELPEIGLRSMVLSDGPSGVRGPVWDERSPSLNLPSATALSSSWDREVAREYGAASASEARRKGVDVVLGPTINLHRSPLGGRHFEAFSEDPMLTSDLAAAYVSGVQSSGVAATPKHYVANDFETERFTASVTVDERTLHELYLFAFEKAVTESHAWAVMSAYNSINGVTATENDLLENPLNSEWGFDGVVISDWTAVRSLRSARAAQDLVMPGSVGPWGEALVAAVRAGEIAEDVIDRKVSRMLRLASRVGALEGFDAIEALPVDGRAFARRAEIAGCVLVANDGILPLETGVRRIAVIGHNATAARSQGGGSATVVPEFVVSPLEGIVAAFPDAHVEYALGAVVQEGLSDLPADELVNPATGGAGVQVRFLDADGTVLFEEARFATSYVWFGGDAPIGRARTIEAVTTWTPRETRRVRLGFAGVGHGVVEVDGQIVIDEVAEAIGDDLGAALLTPPSVAVDLEVVADRAVEVRVRFSYSPLEGGLANAMSLAFGVEPDGSDPEALIADAKRAAAGADVVVLVVGTNSRVESEGYDRTGLGLPGRQDDLARAVIKANPCTIVVVNSGSPVELPWAADAAAVLLTWFGGQEYGAALGDVLAGIAEPGGHLPTTWPRSISDAPVTDVTPVNGVVDYAEGIHIGYRAWLRSGAIPAYWFGEGMGYTTFALGEPLAGRIGDVVVVTVPVTNTGSRRGKHVVQLYTSAVDSSVDRPVRWLVAFEPVEIEPGGTLTVRLEVPVRSLSYWSEGWVHEPGRYRFEVGRSAAVIDAETEIDID